MYAKSESDDDDDGADDDDDAADDDDDEQMPTAIASPKILSPCEFPKVPPLKWNGIFMPRKPRKNIGKEPESKRHCVRTEEVKPKEEVKPNYYEGITVDWHPRNSTNDDLIILQTPSTIFTKVIEVMQKCRTERWSPSELGRALNRLDTAMEHDGMLYETSEMQSFDVFESVDLYRCDTKCCTLTLNDLNDEKNGFL